MLPNNSTAFHANNDDDDSDYGSDFTLEDILQLERLEIQANSEFAPSTAIVDDDDAPGNGYLAYAPRAQLDDNQDAGNEKEVSSQSSNDPAGQKIKRLVSATLSGPLHDPYAFTGNEFATDDFDDDSLGSWDVWKAALPKSNDIEDAAESSTSRVGIPLTDALKMPQSVHHAEQDSSKGSSLLARFRSPPKKPLSVTDIVSPAWCELQYYFTLTRYGKKRPTMAMKRGTEIHAKLENQIFTKVDVSVKSREDTWALQLWNMITSLQMLRETGMTRELQIWGVIDGQVIAGVIDELKTGSPSDEADLASEAELDRSVTTEALLLAKDWQTPAAPMRSNDEQLVFLTDTKTRSNRSIPRGASLRGTIYQLMLYHVLLEDLASHRTDFDVIFKRYNLDPRKSFTSGFLHEMYEFEDPQAGTSSQPMEASQPQDSAPIQSQNQSISTPSSSFLSRMAQMRDGTPAPSISLLSESSFPLDLSQLSSVSSLSQSPPATQIPLPDSLPSTQPSPQPASRTAMPLTRGSIFHRHNTLFSLVDLLRQEVTLTFPNGSASLSPYLHACYRDKNTSEITGRRVFIHDAPAMHVYVASEMAWWTGKRESQGVRAEETFKCGMCEFEAGCGWRAALQEQHEASRQRQAPPQGEASRQYQAPRQAQTARTFSAWSEPTDTDILHAQDKLSEKAKAQDDLYPQVELEDSDGATSQGSDLNEGEAPPESSMPGAWISETSSEKGSRRKGKSRNRSII